MTLGARRAIPWTIASAAAFALIVGLQPASPAVAVPTPGPKNKVLELLVSPFAGVFPVISWFDHQYPQAFPQGEGVALNYLGQRVQTAVKGHPGYDWLMPEGVVIRAVAAGTVFQISRDDSSEWNLECTGGWIVLVTLEISPALRPERPGPEAFRASYGHLSRVSVALGQRVEAGETIGLSGPRGCRRNKHLHFGIAFAQTAD